MKTKGFPSVPEDLLRALEERFPDRLPDDPNVSIEMVRREQGAQSVIAFLRATFERQNENILEKS